MIFASDLDRTIIYSTRAIEELGIRNNTELIPVEKKDGNSVAFMTKHSFISLKEIARKNLFIPVTTRTTEQFRRITLFEKGIFLKYSITTNGAVILHNGEPLEDWSRQIQQHLKSESASEAEMHSCLLRSGFGLNGRLKQVEGLFFYYILETIPGLLEKDEMSRLASEYGWRISLQGRKLYFIPKSISKGYALNYICQREGEKVIAGAGDSVLDWDFLKECKYRFAPRHGELTSLPQELPLSITKNSGVAAGEEMLLEFKKLLPVKI